VSETDAWRELCTEVDGLALEITAHPATPDPAIEKAIASAIFAANEVVGPVRGIVTVLVDDDVRLRGLNKRWRGIDKPTNVLSFGAPDQEGGAAAHLGDIAISYETAAQEARAGQKPLPDHIAHLAAHGFLHLLGYDHESDAEAEAMERLERTILARVGVPDPYVARGTEG
jgi:probable rRNA maturation factor